jgi:3-mercaptopyruvate sulfurtransferase SseA
MSIWNARVKQLLKTEITRKGISNAELAQMLQEIGVKETKASIDSKISRGTFSAAFLVQCFHVMGYSSMDLSKLTYNNDSKSYLKVAEPDVEYKTKKKK